MPACTCRAEGLGPTPKHLGTRLLGIDIKEGYKAGTLKAGATLNYQTPEQDLLSAKANRLEQERTICIKKVYARSGFFIASAAL